MAVIPINDAEHWHKLRKQHLGGSEIAALFESSPYQTPYEIFQEKTGAYEKNIDTPLMHLGRLMEPVIAHYIRDEQHWKLKKCEDYLEHPVHKRLGCTPDYYVIESENGPGILEIKNVQQFSRGWTSTKAPDYVEWQVQHQLLVVNAIREQELNLEPIKWAAIGSMHAGNPEDIRIMFRRPDKEAHNEIIKRCNKFWSDLEQEIEPPIQGSRDYSVIAGMFLSDSTEKEDSVIDLRNDADVDELADKYYKRKEEAAIATKEAKELKTQLMKRMLINKKAYSSARTMNYIINLKESSYLRKPRPAKEVKTLRFNIKTAQEHS